MNKTKCHRCGLEYDRDNYLKPSRMFPEQVGMKKSVPGTIEATVRFSFIDKYHTPGDVPDICPECQAIVAEDLALVHCVGIGRTFEGGVFSQSEARIGQLLSDGRIPGATDTILALKREIERAQANAEVNKRLWEEERKRLQDKLNEMAEWVSDLEKKHKEHRVHMVQEISFKDNQTIAQAIELDDLKGEVKALKAQIEKDAKVRESLEQKNRALRGVLHLHTDQSRQMQQIIDDLQGQVQKVLE